MEWRNLPPLAALRAFGAFVETGSVVAAGKPCLSVTRRSASNCVRLKRIWE